MNDNQLYMQALNDVGCPLLHELLEFLTLENVLELVRRYGGDNIYIPRWSTVTVACNRLKMIDSYFTDHVSIKKLSKMYRYSYRHVAQIIADYQAKEGGNVGSIKYQKSD